MKAKVVIVKEWQSTLSPVCAMKRCEMDNGEIVQLANIDSKSTYGINGTYLFHSIVPGSEIEWDATRGNTWHNVIGFY